MSVTRTAGPFVDESSYDNAAAYGALGDGIFDDSRAIRLFEIARLRNTNRACKVNSDQIHRIRSDTTIAGTYVIEPGGGFSVDAGVTLTITGDVMRVGNCGYDVLFGDGTIVGSVCDDLGLHGPFPDDNILISEDGGALLDPTQGGASNIVIGNHAMADSVTANGVVAIGTHAGENYGQETPLTTNGDFSAGSTGWTLGSGWTVAAGKATHSSGTAVLSQAIDLEAEIAYYITYTVSGRTTGSLHSQLAGGGTPRIDANRSTNGDFTILLVARTGNTTLEFVPSTDFNGSIGNIVLTTLGGRTSVFIGHVAGQYVGNGASQTFVGAFCGQGQETDPETGLDISGANPLNGNQNVAMGEAAGLGIRGSASSNTLVGYASAFILSEGDGNTSLGAGTMQYVTSGDNNVAVGNASYRFGNGSSNVFIGQQSGSDSPFFTSTSGAIAVGEKTIGVEDASGFSAGYQAASGNLFPYDAEIVSVNTGSTPNTITLDVAAAIDFAATETGTVIFGIPERHTGSYNVAIGFLTLGNIQGTAEKNVALGYNTGRQITTGSNNVLLGPTCGRDQTTGSKNILIGDGWQASGVAVSNELNIGNTIFGTGINTSTKTAGSVGIGTEAPTAQLDMTGNGVRVRTARTPASAGAAGDQGDICWDANFVYVCVSTNTWKRAAIATWP